MENSLPPIVNINDVISFSKKRQILWIDARNPNKTLGNATYSTSTIPSVDLDTQLSDSKKNLADGGRHPLPNIADFISLLKDLGISSNSHVVVFDDTFGANAAARFWWMMKSVGHQKVYVLNGGIREVDSIYTLMDPKPSRKQKPEKHQVHKWMLPIAHMDEVERYAQEKNHIVVDVRDPERFKGIHEPIDPIAGHIPGAINIPFKENLDGNGLFLPPDQLREKYNDAFGGVTSENIIFHCGSGVTACHSLLALAYANLKIPKLYVGSWSEWSRNKKSIAND
ncbi:MAG: sulfurtransferase [Flavobacteriaceae bacterium]